MDSWKNSNISGAMSARETGASESALAARGDSAGLFRFARTRSARWRSLRAELARVWKRFGAFEWVAFGYLGFSSVMILVFARNLVRTNVAQPWKLIGAQAIVATIIFLVCRVRAFGISGGTGTHIFFS
jgi:hypothetical protein